MMEKSKINKQDKKGILITLVIGFVAQFFIDSGMDIAILCFCMYLFHKYIRTTENIRAYDSYEFRDKPKYDKWRNLFVGLVDVYIIIRIIFMILKPQSSYVFSEILFIIIIYTVYEQYLDKKYVININILKEKKQVIFVRRKVLSSLVMVIFVLFSIVTFNTFRKLDTEDYAKYGKYEYKVSSIKYRRKIEIELGSHYMMSEESEGNLKYFDTFLEDGKALMKKYVFKSYVFASMLFMAVLCCSEAYPKNEKIVSIVGNIFLISLLLCSIFYFNFDVYDDEMELSSYFHEYMNR